MACHNSEKEIWIYLIILVISGPWDGDYASFFANKHRLGSVRISTATGQDPVIQRNMELNDLRKIINLRKKILFEKIWNIC